MAAKHTILIVDDERYVRDSITEMLASEGFECVAAGSLDEALEKLAARTVHAMVTDLRMPDGDGLALLAAARKLGVEIPMIVMTGVGTLREAVEAMKLGAFDFVQKPADPEQLVLLLRRAVEHERLVAEVRYLREAVGSGGGLVGNSPAMEQVRKLIEHVAHSDATVLISGESGTGKELVAEEIHRRSPRADAAMVRVNCAAIPEQLFESEFFGHRRGAFSGAIAERTGRFAEAHGGTLVLDEVGTLPVAMQAKLLRVLEGGEYQVVGESRTRVADVRVLALTNENLADRVQSGAFRADLFYRLNVFPIAVPPLRAHKEDIEAIAAHLLARMRRQPASRVTREALDVLVSYDWPGNVRELRNVLERASILAGARPFDAQLVRGILEASMPAALASPSDGNDCHLRKNIDAAEKQLVMKALERAGTRKKEAAQLLGIDPRNLAYYLRKHGLSEK
jgi:DNA-binding NtrC family response regulator